MEHQGENGAPEGEWSNRRKTGYQEKIGVQGGRMEHPVTNGAPGRKQGTRRKMEWRRTE